MYSRVYVEITNVCNMSCSFCHGHGRDARMMTAEEFKKVIFALTGRTEYLYYHLMGEPLLHPRLPEFMDMARKTGFKSVITTNGTLLSKRGDELISAGAHKVSISLHSFEKGDDKAFISYMTEVSEFADKASAAGTVVVFRLWNRGLDGGFNAKAEVFLRDRLGGEWVENTKGVRIRKKLHLEWGDRFAWPDMDAPDNGDGVFCYGLRDHFGILCDGTVVPCCLDSEGSISLGNVFRDDLDAVLSSPRASAIKNGFDRRVAVEPLCKRCGYAQRFTL